MITATHFELSADKTQVKILRDGTYQIYVRVLISLDSQSIDRTAVKLEVNGCDMAVCREVATGNIGWNHMTVQIQEIAMLKKNDVLQVYCESCSDNLEEDNANRFIMTYFSD